MLNDEWAVRHAQVALYPRYVARGGKLYRADVFARVIYENGDTEEFDGLTLVRTWRSWRLVRASKPQCMKEGGYVALSQWICPEVFASIFRKALDQAEAFECRP